MLAFAFGLSAEIERTLLSEGQNRGLNAPAKRASKSDAEKGSSPNAINFLAKPPLSGAIVLLDGVSYPLPAN